MSRIPARLSVLGVFAAAPVLLALSTACSSTSVSGEVDGTSATGARSAIFDNIQFFGIQTTVLLLSDIPDGCEVFEELTRVRVSDCVDTCTDLGTVADDFLGRDDYWVANVALNPYDDHVGTYAFDGGLNGEGEFSMTFSALDFGDVYNQESCEDECFANNELIGSDDEESDGGTITVDAYENNVEMTGEFDIDFPGDERLKGRFKAEHCNLEDLFTGGLF